MRKKSLGKTSHSSAEGYERLDGGGTKTPPRSTPAAPSPTLLSACAARAWRAFYKEGGGGRLELFLKRVCSGHTAQG